MVKTIKEQVNEDIFTMYELFKDLNPQKTTEGYKLECPSCGLQGGRTKGFILFGDGKRAFCQSSHRNFTLLEAYALKKGIINCIDGRESGQKDGILIGDLFNKTLDELKEDYDEETYEKILDAANVRIKVELPGNGILDSKFAQTISKRIARKNTMFYRPEMRSIVEIGNIKHSDGEETYNGIIELDPVRFVTLLERYYIPYFKKKKEEEYIDVQRSLNPTKANVIMSSDNFRNMMPKLNRIFTVPIPIIKDGVVIIPKKGYDKRFNSYMPYNSIEIDPNMTLEEGKRILEFIFSEFCFRDEYSKTNAIAGLLTPFLRGLFPNFTTRSPIFVYDANRERAGKDYCANITGMLYEGIALEEPPISTGEKGGNANEELRKKVFTAMMSGRKRLHFSNNKGHINSAVFEGVTTSESYSDRVLGSNKSYQLPNEIDYSISGNVGMSMTPDLMNRSVFIDLVLDIEDANSRQFENPNLHGWVKDNRGKILSALYTLVVNWVDKDCPDGSLPFASFPDWAKICGGVMEAAGYENPCVRNHSDSMIVDSLTSDMKILFEDCYDKYPDEYIQKSDIYNVIKENGEIFTYLDLDSTQGKAEMSKKFIKFCGRILSNIRLLHDGNKRVARRKYCFKSEITNVPTTPLHGELAKMVGIGRQRTTLSMKKNNLFYNIGRGRFATKPTQPTTPQKQKITIEKPPKKKIIQQDDRQQKHRKTQFWEHEDAKDIVKQCTKEQVHEEIKKNEGMNLKYLFDKLGIGTNHYISILIEEGNIKETKEGLFYDTGK